MTWRRRPWPQFSFLPGREDCPLVTLDGMPYPTMKPERLEFTVARVTHQCSAVGGIGGRKRKDTPYQVPNPFPIFTTNAKGRQAPSITAELIHLSPKVAGGENSQPLFPS